MHTDVTKHGTVLVAAFLATSLLNYAFGVALSWFLNPAQFGMLGVAQSLLLLSALIVGSGFAWTAAHDVAALGVTNETRRRFRAAWVANVALGLFLASGLWAAYVTGWLPLGPGYRAVVPLVGLTTVLLAARSVVNGAARGLYRFGPVAVNLVGEVVFKTVGGLILVAVGTGVAGVMAGFALGAAVALAHSLWIVHPARLWHGRGWFDTRVVSVTVPLFVGILGPALMLNLDVLGLKLLAPVGRGDELAGLYQAAVILARTPVFIAQSFTLVLFSYVAGTRGGAERQRGGRSPSPPSSLPYTRMAVRTWARLLLPVGLTLALAPQAALSLFFPTHYQAAASALRIAAGGGVLLALVTLLNGVAQAAGNRRRAATAAGVAVIAQLITLVWLVPTWGVIGAALSLLIAGSTALILISEGLRVGDWGQLRNPQSEIRNLKSVVLPILALVVVLLLLPDGGRGSAALKLGVAGLTYLTLLTGPSMSDLLLRQPKVGLEQRMMHPLMRFMDALIGD